MTGAALDGVSCTSPAQCTATGVVVTRRGNTATTLAERWNGRTWAVQPTPTPRSAGQAGGTLAAGVSCTSATSCVAAGFSYRHHSLTLLAEGWNGTRWTVQPATAPARPVLAYRISCTSGRDCVTVGLQRSGRILAEHWNGRTWSVQPTGRQGVLLGVSCPASGDCEAVGHTLGGDSLAEHWSGASWTAQPAASPPPGSQLMGVSCRRAGVCMAVGTAGAPFAERWTGRTWSVVPVPDPAPRSGIAELISVSCPSATTCLAVGDYENGAGTTDTTLAARWNGAAWTIKATPSPARFSRLVSVSCTSATWCVAVGAAGASASGPARPLAESWDGTAWAVRVTPR